MELEKRYRELTDLLVIFINEYLFYTSYDVQKMCDRLLVYNSFYYLVLQANTVGNHG